MKTHLLALLSIVLLTACEGRQSYTSSAPWKETDKHLSCDQLLLEMNDTKFWNMEARKNKQMGVMDYVWPVSYISTNSSANDAISSTDARLKHLRNIYEIKGCARPYDDTPVQAPRF